MDGHAPGPMRSPKGKTVLHGFRQGPMRGPSGYQGPPAGEISALAAIKKEFLIFEVEGTPFQAVRLIHNWTALFIAAAY